VRLLLITMNFFPDDRSNDPFNGQQPLDFNDRDGLDGPQPESGDPDFREVQNFPRPASRDTQQLVKRMFIILIAVGVVVGLVLAVGVVTLLDKTGLSDVPVPQEPAN
jgi:hypothetical protein